MLSNLAQFALTFSSKLPAIKLKLLRFRTRKDYETKKPNVNNSHHKWPEERTAGRKIGRMQNRTKKKTGLEQLMGRRKH